MGEGRQQQAAADLDVAEEIFPVSARTGEGVAPLVERAVSLLPDGPFYFAGEHLSRIGPWQEGAILSAWRAANMIDKHRRVTNVTKANP